MAAGDGHRDAQHELSVSLATGIYLDGLVPMDSSRSLILEYTAALSGSPVANLGMGYRFFKGIGLMQSCERALPHYEFAANHAAKYIEEAGLVHAIDRIKLSDVVDISSRWVKAEASHELTDYYAHLAIAGDSAAANILGNFYHSGTRLIPIDHKKAIHYLKMAAKHRHPAATGLLGYLLIKVRKYASNNLSA